MFIFWKRILKSSIMSPTVFVVFCVLLSTETILICIWNAFTIFVFWKKRIILKRTYHLLLNLAVADLLVGVVELISLATRSAYLLFSDPIYNYDRNTHHNSYLVLSLTLLFSCSSVFSLAVISLERVYAVLCPLRHRTLNTCVYFGIIAFVWGASIFMTVMLILPAVFSCAVDLQHSSTVISITFLISLSVVSTSYIIIRNHLKRTRPIFDSQSTRNMDRNIKLSKTLFIVTGLSLICWLPAVLLYIITDVCRNCLLNVKTLMLIVTVLHLANSVVNPFVYSYRMPMFKDALRKLFRARGHQRENGQIRRFGSVLGKTLVLLKMNSSQVRSSLSYFTLFTE